MDGDYISIQEIDSNGNAKLVAFLTGGDAGPKSIYNFGSWNKKTISISTNKMDIEFKSDDIMETKGFSANIQFTPISSKECESWLDMNKKTFKSPNYPQLYHNSGECLWLITVDHNYHIMINFIGHEVRNHLIMIPYYL